MKRTRKLAMVVAAAVLTVGPAVVAAAPTAAATTMNCVYSGPVVGHPGMQYICYVHHDNGDTEVFYAPGPAGRI
ncbi:hypothetical protein [Nocardia mangyaensis]|uniref:hypothetical protein n=1 Tax=Nocardia mangyaensis TaxID=2213200 RepID=UPI002675AD1A|nr:hypothetical protein [Nocardia mangyaensis]MDO3645874.1 hypothetical protein [Nocardia mangyaensis]